MHDLLTRTPSPEPRPSSMATRLRHWWKARLIMYTTTNQERGMSTAEYAVGTIAACAFAALLFKVVSSPEVHDMLAKLIDRALKTAG
ncbi:DUF4244 domain-containing protein [Nonomuraea sediminis]|uniref:DUF4244 domain-containing protein n=1 Tax=Nonomuraea sediminis TaxID=2835864 RepID=UPI0027E209A0|nr:DUF4244 domain-containing protein [Nonomuraea sediminis]